MKINNYFLNNTRVYFLLLSIYFVGGLATIIASKLVGINKYHIGIAFLIGSLLTLLVSPTTKSKFLTIKDEKIYFKVSTILYCFVYVFSFMCFFQSLPYYTRGLDYFVSLSVICIIICFQILSSTDLNRKQIVIILLEIFLVSINVSSTSFFLFPNLQGNDATFHEQFLNEALSRANLNGTGSIYYEFPVFHIVLLSISELIGINLKNSFFLLSLFEIVMSIFVYLLASKIFENRIGLIAFLLYSMSDYFISARIQVAPSFFAVVYIMMLLYFFIAKKKSESNIAIFLVTFFLLVFSHPLSTLILVFSFILYFIISKNRENSVATLSMTILLVTATISKWIYSFGTGGGFFGGDFFGNVVFSFKQALTNVDMEANIGQATFAPNLDWTSVALADMGYSILIVLALVGCLVSIQNKTFIEKDSFKFSLLVLLMIPVPYVLTLSFPSSIPARWFIVLELILSIGGGAGLYFIYSSINKSKFKSITYIILGFMVFFMITSPVANSDSPIYSKEIASRSGFYDSELSSAKFVNLYHSTNFSTNSKFIHQINRSQAQFEHFINPNESISYNKNLLIIRNYDMDNGFTIPYFGSQNKLLEVIPANKQFVTHIQNIHKVYDNNNVKMYLN
jgi:hypothetical protein